MFMMNSGNKLSEWNDQKLQRLTEKISRQFFQRPFKHQASFNSRLRTTGGRYLLVTHNIEINPLVVIHGKTELLIGVIKHELCHYHLHLMGKPHTHQAGEFKNLLMSTQGIRYVPQLQPLKLRYLYVCSDCGQRYYRQRKINLQKFVCGRCHGKLKLGSHFAS